MTDKFHIETGKTYHPKSKEDSIDEVVGNYWRAWTEGGKYFYEFDEGHFATKFKKFEILEEDFLLIKNNKITHNQVLK